MNETRARHELAVIFQRVENREAWKKRPPSARAKEDCRFLGVKLNADSTHADATAAVKSRYMELEGSGDSLAARFDAYSGVLDDFADASFREEYAMKKPSYSQIRAAIESLAGEGATWEIACNAGDVADRLLEMYPGLAR